MSKKKELYVAIHKLSFCLHDEDGNEVLNKDGTTKEYALTYKADKYFNSFFEGLEPTDLEEISELQKAIATIFEFIERTQAGNWQELKDLLEQLELEGVSNEQ